MSKEKAVKTKRIALGVFMGVLVLAVAAAGLWGLNRPAPVSSDSLLSTKAEPTGNSVTMVSVSSAVQEYSLQSLSEFSSLIAYGKVTYIGKSFLLQNAYGGTSSYMDVEIKPEHVFRGTADETFTLRVSGGLAGNSYTNYEEEPELKLGESYLFYLYKPGYGGGVNGPGDYYYLVGLSQGVYVPVLGDKTNGSENDIMFVNCENAEEASASQRAVQNLSSVNSMEELLNKDLSPLNTALSLSGMEKAYPAFNKRFPVDEGRYRREVTEAWESNLKQGTITQEEYDSYFANLDVYADEVTEET